jgi:hypothetical protein
MTLSGKVDDEAGIKQAIDGNIWRKLEPIPLNFAKSGAVHFLVHDRSLAQ